MILFPKFGNFLKIILKLLLKLTRVPEPATKRVCYSIFNRYWLFEFICSLVSRVQSAQTTNIWARWKGFVAQHLHQTAPKLSWTENMFFVMRFFDYSLNNSRKSVLGLKMVIERRLLSQFSLLILKYHGKVEDKLYTLEHKYRIDISMDHVV
jgi:hypothetical protein